MKLNEAIDVFINQFKGITNELQALEREVTDTTMNNKILRSLPKWNTIIHPLEMIHDVNTLKFQEIMEILKNGRIKLQAQQQNEEAEVSNARRKRIALKGTKDEFSFGEDYSQDEDNEDVGLVGRRPFKEKKKLFKRRPQHRPIHKKEEIPSITCFECKNLEHLRKIALC